MRFLLFFQTFVSVCVANPADAVERVLARIRGRFVAPHLILTGYAALDGTTDPPTPQECRAGEPNAPGFDQPIRNGAQAMEGLPLLNSISGGKGFVARGVSMDGVSRDPMGFDARTAQWSSGLWRYYRAGVATPREKTRIAGHLPVPAPGREAMESNGQSHFLRRK